VEVALQQDAQAAEVENASGDCSLGEGEAVEELRCFLFSRSCSLLSGPFVY